jgi:hypothetical protein
VRRAALLTRMPALAPGRPGAACTAASAPPAKGARPGPARIIARRAALNALANPAVRFASVGLGGRRCGARAQGRAAPSGAAVVDAREGLVIEAGCEQKHASSLSWCCLPAILQGFFFDTGAAPGGERQSVGLT